MAKAPDAFRTISEVADWLDTPAHVLRFWESKFSQVKPVKRAGGRRYYRPDDVALLSGIKTLLHDQGMTIKGAQKVLREQGVKHVIALGKSRHDDDIAIGETVDMIPHQSSDADKSPSKPETASRPPDDSAAQSGPTADPTPETDSKISYLRQPKKSVDSAAEPEATNGPDAAPTETPVTSTETAEVKSATRRPAAPASPQRVSGALSLALQATAADLAGHAQDIAPLLDRLAAIQTRLRNAT